MESSGTVSAALKSATLGLSYMPELYTENDTTFNLVELTFETEGISSNSYLYDTSSNNGNFYTRRKNFTEISDYELGQYLESIYYNDENLIKDNLEGKLLPHKNNAYIIGYSFEKFKQKGFDRVRGYDEYLNGFYLGKQYYLTSEFDYGLVFSYTSLDSDYYSNAGKISKRYFLEKFFIEPELKGYAMNIFQKNINEDSDEYELHIDGIQQFFSKGKAELAIGQEFFITNDTFITLKLKGALAQEINTSKDLNVHLKNISNEKAKIDVSRGNVFSKEIGGRIDLEKKSNDVLSLYADYSYIFETDNSWKFSIGINCKF